MKVWVKIHLHEQVNVIAICDENILGNIYEEDIKILNVAKEFYKGELKEIKEVINLIQNKDFSSVNIVGNKVIEELLSRKIIKNFKVIASIKYAHIYNVKE